MLSYIVVYLEINLADARKILLANGPPRADLYLPCLSSALASFFFSEYYNVAGGSGIRYIRYTRIRWKGRYIFIFVYILSIVYCFLYIKNVIPVDSVKVACLYIAVRILFENPFSDEKNAVENKMDENETDEDKTGDEAGNENKAE